MEYYRIISSEGVEQPVVVSIPHTGTHIPADIAATLNFDLSPYVPGTDWHLHELYAFLPQLGITTLCATHHRVVVDLNRPRDGRPLYPGRFETGLIARITPKNERIFKIEPSPDQEAARIAQYYDPYHAALAGLLQDKIRRFGHVLLVDAHSVASDANAIHSALDRDIYLGNRDHSTCPPAFLQVVGRLFEAEGLQTSYNMPYKGGYITDHYGRLPGVRAFQIEMVQRVYLDEDQVLEGCSHPSFRLTQEKLRRIFDGLIAQLPNLAAA